MKKYDVIVIGSGCGTTIAFESLSHGLKVALVDRGPYGGTCLNLGCIPSKMLIYPADRIMDILESKKLGIQVQITRIDFKYIMERMRNQVKEGHDDLLKEAKSTKKFDFYEGTGRFVKDYVIEINGQEITAGTIFIASGSRTAIPQLEGLNTVNYFTSESLLQLQEKPESLIIMGGGYIAAEYSHFFAALGTRVTILEMANRLVIAEEPEISELLKTELSKRMDIFVNTQVVKVRSTETGIAVSTKDSVSGNEREFVGQNVMVALGRRSNADLLKVENTGVELDKRGFIRVDEYLETTKKNIFAVGDANGQQMFTHVANMEASIAANNFLHNEKIKMDYSAAPHAVFSRPQIASVGMTEEQATKYHGILIGKTKYFDTAKGDAMMEENGFAKTIVEKESGKILGFHIVGPYAPEIIQEVVNAMVSGGNIDEIRSSMHIHPAISELVPATLSNLEAPKNSGK